MKQAVEIRFDWYEGDCGRHWIVTEDIKQLEVDMIKAVEIADKFDYKYCRCLPSFYDKIIEELNKKYIIIDYINDEIYHVDDETIRLRDDKIEFKPYVSKKITNINFKRL